MNEIQVYGTGAVLLAECISMLKVLHDKQVFANELKLMGDTNNKTDEQHEMIRSTIKDLNKIGKRLEKLGNSFGIEEVKND